MKRQILMIALCAGVSFTAVSALNLKSASAVSIEKAGDHNGSHLTLTRGKSKVIKVSDDIADVLVADPSVIEVGAIKKNRLYLVGAALGDTNVTVFDRDGNTIDQIDVHVRVDEATLQKTLETLFPDQNVIAKTVNDDIMLTGYASNPAVSGRIEAVAARFAGNNEAVVNMMTVLGEQQVMLKVRVMEVSRSILNELGVQLDGSLTTSDLDAGLFSNYLGLTAAAPLIDGQFVGNFGDLDVGLFFSALERDGYITTLAEPNLTAITGENARFLAGGEFPIPTEIDDEGNVTYTYRPFGVALAFKPVVLDKQRINLNVSTEVSNISNDLTFEFGDLSVPGFDVRRAETSVEMPSGGTLMLAGLIESNTLANMNRVPGIKNIPIIGDLLSSESFQRNETELVVLISSYLVSPYAENETAAKIIPDSQTSPLYLSFINSLKDKYSENDVINLTNGMPVGYILD
jgi:pilus assembly protein CpaC